MENTVNNILSHADYFVLLMVRTGGLVMNSQVFGRVLVPQQAKLCLMLAMGYFFFSITPPELMEQPIAYNSLISYMLLIASEMIIGLALAYVTNAFFALTSIAGHSIDMQIGFGMVNVYDIQNQTNSPIMGNVLNLTTLIIFFLMDGHLKLIDILYTTVRNLPVGVPVFATNAGLTALEIFSKMFLLGVMTAFPVIASGLMIEFSFGVLMRSVPQMHMMVVGVPLKLIVGFIIFSAMLPVYVGLCPALFEQMFDWLDMMFESLAGRS